MSKSRLDVLFYPFESGAIEGPGADAKTLFLGAETGFVAAPAEFGQLAAIQGFRPEHLVLAASGADVSPQPEGDGYDCALVLAGRNRLENEARIRGAIQRTRPGAFVVVGGAKSDGAASLLKRLDALVVLDGRAAKYHGGVGWFRRPDDAGCGKMLTALASEIPLADGRFHTGIGTFSAGEVDPGSRLLADSLPRDLKGAAADFGAGWGYLSVRLAECEAIRSIDLYEASFEALEAAKANLEPMGRTGFMIRYLWQDLLTEPVTTRYDVIVMNPPFHRGRAAEPDIGVSMIRTALGALKRGGRLFMVANRGLPYEAVLESGAKAHGELARNERYRVLWASR